MRCRDKYTSTADKNANCEPDEITDSILENAGAQISYVRKYLDPDEFSVNPIKQITDSEHMMLDPEI
jgi:hypothetical protein